MNEKFYMSVMELINAYEKALILSINNKQTETTPKILMMNQVITMEAAVETGELGFGLSVAEIAKQMKEEKTNNKVYSAVDSGKKKNFFTECYIDGQLATEDSSILANKFKWAATSSILKLWFICVCFAFFDAFIGTNSHAY